MKQVFDSWIKGGYLNNRWLGYDKNYYSTQIIGNINLWFEKNKINGNRPTSFEELENATANDLNNFAIPSDSYNNIQSG
jgi:hypothetical protein